MHLHQYADQVAQALPQTTLSQPFGEGCNVYKVANKVYLMAFKLEGKAVLNIKVEPQHSEMLRDFYPFIHAGYHMNKRHWISLYEHEEVKEDLVQDLIQSSYDLVVKTLSKNDQNRISLLRELDH
ncbi:MmcQ/YjbR family DNA-binding protein [Acinetobacter shaoyimingii]|uniref:MmcQ/YjbR family DNA-binding protein n=1 Tax=Acinetobacter shaoyimingii TaxID=2715164 RepID=UPI0038781F38